MPLEDCIRQQAGSYGRHPPTNMAFAADPAYARVPVDTSSAGDPVFTTWLRHPLQIPCRSTLACDAVCQTTMMPLEDCVRQQAGSYGRHSPTDASFAADSAYARVPVDTSSAGDPVFTTWLRHPLQIPCRSTLAREGVGSGDVKGEGRLCSSAITPKTACTQGFWFRPSTDSQSRPAPAAPDAVRPPAPPGPRPLVHPLSHGCGNGTLKCSSDRPAC
jgi:hypothetical protein